MVGRETLEIYDLPVARKERSLREDPGNAGLSGVIRPTGCKMMIEIA